MRCLLRSLTGACYRASVVGLAKGPHLTRYAMYQHLREVFKTISLEGACLSISHSGELCGVLGIREVQITEANYPGYNILDLPFEDERFACVVSDQVLEHVEGDPRQAIRESLRITRPGGYVVHTSCLLNPIHNYPGDYWRFTPGGLRLLAREMGTVIDCGGWGNPLVPLALLLGLRQAPVPEARWHPAHLMATMNRSAYPCVVWVVLRKCPDMGADPLNSSGS
ncbi:MAG: methyltransferase domain-containing protein [Pirellulales bacterium]